MHAEVGVLCCHAKGYFAETSLVHGVALGQTLAYGGRKRGGPYPNTFAALFAPIQCSNVQNVLRVNKCSFPTVCYPECLAGTYCRWNPKCAAMLELHLRLDAATDHSILLFFAEFRRISTHRQVYVCGVYCFASIPLRVTPHSWLQLRRD
jgi:hypothetical protein